MADIDFTQSLGMARATFTTISDAVNPDKLRTRIADLEKEASAPVFCAWRLTGRKRS